MKKVILSLALACFGIPAFAAAAKFEGACFVVQPPIGNATPGVLASVPVALNPGDSQTIYKDGNILYQVSLFDLQGTSPAIHSLEINVTYGAPHSLGGAIVDFTDASIKAGTVPGVHIVMPNFPAFSCQSK